MGHILGRFEKDAGTYYPKMLDNAATYHHMEILTMSRLTQNLLKAIDYEQIRQKRNENYSYLKALLPSDSPFTRVTPDGPFAYPYYHKKLPDHILAANTANLQRILYIFFQYLKQEFHVHHFELFLPLFVLQFQQNLHL